MEKGGGQFRFNRGSRHFSRRRRRRRPPRVRPIFLISFERNWKMDS